MPVIPYGYCHCGCGEKAAVPKRTDPGMGRFAGVPLRFKRGHYANRKERTRRGTEAAGWKGGKTHTKAGYVLVKIGDSRVYEHRLVMERAIGRRLTTKEHVHHINGDVSDNRLENLQLFADSAAHHNHHASERWDLNLLRRMRSRGLSPAEMARRLGVPDPTLRHALRRYGI